MPPKGGDLAYDHDELVGVVGVDLDVDGVDIGEPLKQDALALHDGFAGQGPDVAEAEDSRAVRDDGQEVSLDRAVIRRLRVSLDDQARFGYAGRVGQRKVPLGSHTAWSPGPPASQDGAPDDTVGLLRESFS